MEKYQKELAVTELAVLGVGLVVGAFWWRGRKKRKAEAWEGTVEDKSVKTITDSEGDDTDYYYLHVRVSPQEVKLVEVKEKLYNEFSKGDKAVKTAGEYNPRKG
jgi:hypothetical protein